MSKSSLVRQSTQTALKPTPAYRQALKLLTEQRMPITNQRKASILRELRACRAAAAQAMKNLK